MIEMDGLKHMLTGAGTLMIIFSVFGQIIYSGMCADYSWENSYDALIPGRFGSYWQLSIGIVVMGFFAFVCFLAYFVLSILGLSIMPDLVLHIIGIVSAVFWFGMFIAECCAISWVGPNSITPTRKAFAKDEFSKTINSGKEDDDWFYIYPTDDDSTPILSLTTYIKSTDPFDPDKTFDEYKSGKITKTPCVKTFPGNKEICLGGWTVKKMKKYNEMNEKKMKEALEDEFKKALKTVRKQTFMDYSDSKKDKLYSTNGNYGSIYSVQGIVYSEITSIFLGGQIIGIIFYAGSIVLSFIGSFGGGNENKKEKSEEKNEDKNEDT